MCPSLADESLVLSCPVFQLATFDRLEVFDCLDTPFPLFYTILHPVVVVCVAEQPPEISELCCFAALNLARLDQKKRQTDDVDTVPSLNERLIEQGTRGRTHAVLS